MLNYEVDPSILDKYLPAYTEIDRYDGKVLVSIVGFLFNDTRVFGLRWPWHTNFEEVNLRFYTKHYDGLEWKRGVTFVSEIVPSPIIATIANTLYNEQYSFASMRHTIESEADHLHVSYDWKLRGKTWNRMEVEASNQLTDIEKGSAEEFIFEHYYGYNPLTTSTTIEYSVEHPRWQVYPVQKFSLSGDIAALYGASFAPFISGVAPHSVMLARGSDVTVRKPVYLKGN